MGEVRQAGAVRPIARGSPSSGARAKVPARIDRLIGGNPSHVIPVRAGVSELRINYGPGYRVYDLQRGSVLIILLAGGDQSSKAKDIDESLLLATNLTEES